MKIKISVIILLPIAIWLYALEPFIDVKDLFTSSLIINKNQTEVKINSVNLTEINSDVFCFANLNNNLHSVYYEDDIKEQGTNLFIYFTISILIYAMYRIRHLYKPEEAQMRGFNTIFYQDLKFVSILIIIISVFNLSVHFYLIPVYSLSNFLIMATIYLPLLIAGIFLFKRKYFLLLYLVLSISILAIYIPVIYGIRQNHFTYCVDNYNYLNWFGNIIRYGPPYWFYLIVFLCVKLIFDLKIMKKYNIDIINI
jgi:hypothetical protein